MDPTVGDLDHPKSRHSNPERCRQYLVSAFAMNYSAIRAEPPIGSVEMALSPSKPDAIGVRTECHVLPLRVAKHVAENENNVSLPMRQLRRQ